jgi:hypothetical protein
VSELQKDYLVAKEIVKESIKGNSDASIFLAKAQKNLILCCLLRGYANKISQLADQLSVDGRLALARDGRQVSQSLKAQADLILYSIASRIRDSWKNNGENPIPEDKTVLLSQRIASSPIKVISSNKELREGYGALSRFMNFDAANSKLVSKEKKLLFKAKTSVPLICEIVPKKVLDCLKIDGAGTKSVFLCYFKNRLQKAS